METVCQPNKLLACVNEEGQILAPILLLQDPQWTIESYCDHIIVFVTANISNNLLQDNTNCL